MITWGGSFFFAAFSFLRRQGLLAKRLHLPNFVRLALSTGCRKNELLALERHRVDFERSCLRLEVERTKNGKRRLVPLNGSAMSTSMDRRDRMMRKFSGSVWVFPSWSGKRI
ncbi:tyrosine-type recombinase/integrase [Burkholderia ubonensis]|uniref:tyrosine-type recombinase/integrase n=1 Tax=Burkholderia ubonensis TaxID=101571 RepID=UPI001E35892F|nr:tyrosine-type recombinase/integrase [Burkholderia ubonensis]